MRYSQQPGGPGPAMLGHAMQQPVAGPYPDKVAKHPPTPGYRHVIPTPNVPQAKSYFLTPKGIVFCRKLFLCYLDFLLAPNVKKKGCKKEIL